MGGTPQTSTPKCAREHWRSADCPVTAVRRVDRPQRRPSLAGRGPVTPSSTRCAAICIGSSSAWRCVSAGALLPCFASNEPTILFSASHSLRCPADSRQATTFDPFDQQVRTAIFEGRFHTHFKELKAQHPHLPRDLTFGSVFYLYATETGVDAAPPSAFARPAEPAPPAHGEGKRRRKSSAGSQPPLKSPRVESAGASPALVAARAESTLPMPSASTFELK